MAPLTEWGSAKSSLGCLTYSRIWCLSRGKRNILWPESGKGIELGKRPGFKASASKSEDPGGVPGNRKTLKLLNLETSPCSGAGANAIFGRGTGYGSGESARRSIAWDASLNSWGWGAKLGGCERHVDVFEKNLAGDPSHAVRGLDEVIAGAAGLFAAESVGKDERFSELTSAHQETGAVDSPLAFEIHKCFLSPLGWAGVRFWLSGFRFRPSTDAARRTLVSSGATVRAERERVNYIRIVQRWNSGLRIGWDESGSRFDRRQLRLAHERRGLSGARKIVLDAALHGDWDLHIECTGFTKSKVAKFQGFKVSKILITCAIDTSLKPHLVRKARNCGKYVQDKIQTRRGN